MHKTIEYKGTVYEPRGNSEIIKRQFFRDISESISNLPGVETETFDCEEPPYEPPYRITECYSENPDRTRNFSLIEKIYFLKKTHVPVEDGKRYDEVTNRYVVQLSGDIGGKRIFDVGKDVDMKEIKLYDPNLLWFMKEGITTSLKNLI